MTAVLPVAAARAATAFARFPVEVAESVSRPNSIAFAAAIATTRSLNEWVGFERSSFSHTSPMPSACASLGAGTRGVIPGPLAASSGGIAGSRSAYRQSERGPASIRSRVTNAASASQS